MDGQVGDCITEEIKNRVLIGDKTITSPLHYRYPIMAIAKKANKTILNYIYPYNDKSKCEKGNKIVLGKETAPELGIPIILQVEPDDGDNLMKQASNHTTKTIQKSSTRHSKDINIRKLGITNSLFETKLTLDRPEFQDIYQSFNSDELALNKHPMQNLCSSMSCVESLSQHSPYCEQSNGFKKSSKSPLKIDLNVNLTYKIPTNAEKLNHSVSSILPKNILVSGDEERNNPYSNSPKNVIYHLNDIQAYLKSFPLLDAKYMVQYPLKYPNDICDNNHLMLIQKASMNPHVKATNKCDLDQINKCVTEKGTPKPVSQSDCPVSPEDKLLQAYYNSRINNCSRDISQKCIAGIAENSKKHLFDYNIPEMENDQLNSNSTFKFPQSVGYQTNHSELHRKRRYRICLNIFNRKPEHGIDTLINEGFLKPNALSLANFLLNRKGLARQMIGEYLGNIKNSHNLAVLKQFLNKISLSDMEIDMALRKFQSYFHMPGEAQKIEKLMELFSERYIQCNKNLLTKFRSRDTIFILAFAIVMLNTDLHSASLKSQKRMKPEDFIKNLRGLDDGADIDKSVLIGIYERIKREELIPNSDHVTQVSRLEKAIIGKKPALALPHRRLVCYCRLYEVLDKHKKEKSGTHQREVFLFNDILILCKLLHETKLTRRTRNSAPSLSNSVPPKDLFFRQVVSTIETQAAHVQTTFKENTIGTQTHTIRKLSLNNPTCSHNIEVKRTKKAGNIKGQSQLLSNPTTYSFRQLITLKGIKITTSTNEKYMHMIHLMDGYGSQLICLNAKSDHDRTKFVEDLKEVIEENEEMENIRLNANISSR